MQLKKRNKMPVPKTGAIAGALAAATCALVGAPAHAEEDGWRVDSAVLFYTETDRVSAAEPVIKAKKKFANESELEMKLTLDSLTGASHNGAITSKTKAQTFTSPSGGSSYTVQPGEVPLDDTFKDTRGAFNLQYTRPLNRTLRATGGFNFSNEYDFTSFGANAGLLWDLNNKNTTVTLALAHEADSIDPVGGVPTPMRFQSEDDLPRGSSEDRSVNDFLLGWTQVMNRRWLMMLNYNLSTSSGYHTDPYKVLTLVDASGEPLEAESFGEDNIGPGDAQVFERRPDKRTKHAVYWENRYTLDNDDVIAGSYRFMTDDWGISSHTLDFKYRWVMENDWYLQPHVRYYMQTAADFWHESLTVAEYNQVRATNDDASADYRLGDLTDVTVGLRLGRELSKGREWSARLELMQQSGDTDAAEVDAVIAQLGYTFYW